MTEVTVRTDENPIPAVPVVPDIVDDHEIRLQGLENDAVTDTIDNSVAMDEMSTRIRDLETRLEMATKQNADPAPPEEPAVPDPEPIKVDEPEQPEVPEPDVEIEAEPAELPTDPTERPELNPQGEVTEIEKEVETPEVKKTTRKRTVKVPEDSPKQKKGLATFILGGSGGMHRKRRKVSK